MRENLPKLRSRVGMVFQHFELFPHMTITENLTIAQVKVLGRSKAEATKKGLELLERVGLSAHAHKHPGQLSGGQKQRVAIASAIASERPVILFDEPTSGLDLFHMRQVADSVKGLADSGKTIVIVTHDPEFILRCCNYVIHLENGRLEENYFLQDTEGRERLFNFFMMEGGGGNQTV